MTEVEDRSKFGSIKGYSSSRYMLTFPMVSDVTPMSTVCLNKRKTVNE